MSTSVIGYPRIGSLRELKFALEAYFKGEKTEDENTEGSEDKDNDKDNNKDGGRAHRGRAQVPAARFARGIRRAEGDGRQKDESKRRDLFQLRLERH